MPEGFGEIEEMSATSNAELGGGCPKNGGGNHETVDIYGSWLSGNQDCVIGEKCEKCGKYFPYPEPVC